MGKAASGRVVLIQEQPAATIERLRKQLAEAERERDLLLEELERLRHLLSQGTVGEAIRERDEARALVQRVMDCSAGWDYAPHIREALEDELCAANSWLKRWKR